MWLMDKEINIKLDFSYLAKEINNIDLINLAFVALRSHCTHLSIASIDFWSCFPYVGGTGEYFTKILGPPPSGKKSASWQKVSEKS